MRLNLAETNNLDNPLRLETIEVDLISLPEIVKARAVPVTTLWPKCPSCGAEVRLRLFPS